MTILATLKTPVFKAEGIPSVNEEDYRLKIWGLIGEERQFTLDEIKTMPGVRQDARLTSVSGFSIRANWHGILWTDFMKNFKLLPLVKYVTFTSIGGYDTCIPLAQLSARVMLAWGVDGEPLEPKYGYPLRLLVPHLWGYKSCKWVSEIEFHVEERGGFWEDRGYSRSGTIEPGLTLDINTRTQRPIQGGKEVTEF